MKNVKLIAPGRLAKLAHAYLAAQSPKATTRRLSESELREAFATHAKHVRKAPANCAVVTRANGGAVPNAYAAESDRFEIITEADGSTSMRVFRGYAPKAPHGVYPRRTVRYVAPGQTDGRRVEG